MGACASALNGKKAAEEAPAADANPDTQEVAVESGNPETGAEKAEAEATPEEEKTEEAAAPVEVVEGENTDKTNAI